VDYGLGIDVGTTFTAAAVRQRGRVEVVRLGRSRPEIPSLVFAAADGTVVVGDAAERRGATEPGRLAREFKRRVGDPVPILVGGAPYSAHAVTARLLHEVLQTVTRQQEGPPAAVMVTYPANWGPYKRELMTQALRQAELRSAALMPEPEAAAVQYAAGEQVQPGEVVAVYDLGGGTFDAAVLRKTATGFDLLGEPEGIEQLGGIDFDEAVFGHVMGALGDAADRLDPDDEAVTTALARLRADCVAAKEALSFDTEVMIQVALPGLHRRVRLNRSEFEAMITPALADTVAGTYRALRSAGVAPAELKSVVLAGGSSRIPLIGQLLAGELDRPVLLDPHPEHSIALGAALSTAPAEHTAPAKHVAPAKHATPAKRIAPAKHAAPTPAGTTTTAAAAGTVPRRVTGTATVPVREPTPGDGEPPPPAAGPPAWRSLAARLRQAPRWLTVTALILTAMLLGTGTWLVVTAFAGESTRRPAGPVGSVLTTPSPTLTPTPNASPTPAPTTGTQPPVPEPTRAMPQRVRVPDLVGLTESEAKRQLSNAGLTARITRRTTTGTAPGTVLSTGPDGGTLVDPGATVTVIVAARPTPATSTPTSPPRSVSPPSGRPTTTPSGRA
jgi:hypothetical protein